MKIFFLNLMLVFFLSSFSQTTKMTIGDRNVQKQLKYDIEDSVVVDSVYIPTIFQYKRKLEIYYDPLKTILATAIEFGTIHQFVQVNHFNRAGEKIKTLTFPLDKKKYFKTDFKKEMLRNSCILKSFVKDSLCLYEIYFTPIQIRRILRNRTNQVVQESDEVIAFKEAYISCYTELDKLNQNTCRKKTSYQYYPVNCGIQMELKEIIEETIFSDISTQTGEEIKTMVWKKYQFDQSGCLIKKE